MADVRARDARISIPWRDWTPEAFRQAQELDRPILLSIGAVWCHWCHVMDRSTFSDPEVIRRVSEELVPIRVDNDRRPDINSRYNLGGWPTNALLSPEGDMLTGGTYLPPEELLSLIDEVQAYYRERRDELEERIAKRRVRRARIAELRAKLRAPMGPEVVDSVAEAVRQVYDPQYGGFGKAPKFPMPDALDFALAIGYLRREPAFTDIAADTLTAMAEGGIHDAEGGGFFRYATREDWGAPHYEKMLEGNARLLSVYLHAARLLDRPLYWAAARGIVAWLTQTARLENGCFAGSQDADEEYYHLPASTRSRRVAPRPRASEGQSSVCTTRPWPLRIRPTMPSPGIGRQQRASCTAIPSEPRIRIAAPAFWSVEPSLSRPSARRRATTAASRRDRKSVV